MSIAATSDDLLAGIRSWVEIESHTADTAGVNAMADKVAADYATTGAEIIRVPGSDGRGDHLIVRAPWTPGNNAPGILLLSHMDTVHPRGTLADFPFRTEGDIAFGPGIYDMKGGAYIAMAAVADIAAAGGAPLPVTHLFVSDEEIGSPTSRDLITELGKAAKYVLVTEPAREGGKIVIARKGVARYEVRAFGRAAHAGARHRDGHNAIAEIARLVLKFQALTDYETGLTANVGQITGGTGANVVPAEAWIRVDLRLPDMAALELIETFVAGLAPEDPDIRLEITGGLDRPPYEQSAGIAVLFSHARALAGEIGFDLQGLKTGGCSDGNFTAPHTPTLDGLGVDGKGGHTDYEQLYISSLVPRRMLLRRLIETLA